jgi:hypothetical protein
MAEELAKGSIEWFKSKIGLSTEELHIRRELNESHVFMEECECLWGPRKSKNRFKMTRCKEASLVVVIIKKLWSLVY